MVVVNSWWTVFCHCWMLGVFSLRQILTNAGTHLFYDLKRLYCLFLYVLASASTASSLNPGHLCLVSAGSTEDSFPETVLIKQAAFLDASLDCDWPQKSTPLVPLDNYLSLVLVQRAKMKWNWVERESYGWARSTFEGYLALSDGVGSVVQSTDLAGQTHIQ